MLWLSCNFSITEFVELEESEAKTLKSELEALKAHVLNLTYHETLTLYHHQEFDKLSKNGEFISKEDFIQWMKSLSGHISGKDVKNYLGSVFPEKIFFCQKDTFLVKGKSKKRH